MKVGLIAAIRDQNVRIRCSLHKTINRCFVICKTIRFLFKHEKLSLIELLFSLFVINNNVFLNHMSLRERGLPLTPGVSAAEYSARNTRKITSAAENICYSLSRSSIDENNESVSRS